MKKTLTTLLLFVLFLPSVMASVEQHLMTVQIFLPVQGKPRFHYTQGNHYNLIVTSKSTLLPYQNSANTMKGTMPGSLFRKTWTLQRFDEPQMPLLKLGNIYFWVNDLSFDQEKNQYSFRLSSDSLFAKDTERVLSHVKNELLFLITCPQRTQPNYGPPIQVVTCPAWNIMAINKR